MDDYYELLGIDRLAGHSELRRAFRRLALKRIRIAPEEARRRRSDHAARGACRSDFASGALSSGAADTVGRGRTERHAERLSGPIAGLLARAAAHRQRHY